MTRSRRDLPDHPAERLVISGYRNMMAALDLGDGACWEEIWRAFTRELGPEDARRTVGEVQYWVRTLRACSARALGFYPQCSGLLCEDECMALTLVAAAQAGDASTGCEAASLLTGSGEAARLREVWQASCHLATALTCSGCRMQACPLFALRTLN
ncbi:hypothetical protein DK847_18570 [Aestuariivirga litoralis]|uniref:Uncharacterized protein n=1 Tax=Aestuariivirga litoralis TaxID=2650924 RepID=A0A2W2BPJ7_9HYPH|nr:hypothetical protein [Aestuariivirga litoralis]PZF75336.1 hypothetical protein DK847_18570 [Aestuariivirga litoralis]